MVKTSTVFGDRGIGPEGEGIAAAAGALRQGVGKAKPTAHQVFGVVDGEILKQI